MTPGQAETQSQSAEIMSSSHASPPTPIPQPHSTTHDQSGQISHPPMKPKQIADTITTTISEDTSSSGTSTPTSDTESDPEDTDPSIHTNPAGLATTKPPSTDIHNRLTSFFSQLAEQRAHPDEGADEVIEHGTDSDSGYEEDDDDGKQYVELDLALGVLSEGEGRDEVDVEVPEDEDEDGGDGGEESIEQGASDVLQDLRSISKGQSKSSRRTKQKKRKIEEVG